jgi:hypothetical protein
MLCPGVYPPDPTLGITDPQMLPPSKLVRRSRNHLFPASLYPVRPLFHDRHVRLGRAQGPLHPSCRGLGRSARGGGRLALSDRQLAPLARPSGFRPLRNHPELGGGQGEKRRPSESGPTTSIGPSTASPGTSPLTSCTTVPSASCRSSTTAPSRGCATRSLIIPRLTAISGSSSGGFGRPWPAAA